MEKQQQGESISTEEMKINHGKISQGCIMPMFSP